MKVLIIIKPENDEAKKCAEEFAKRLELEKTGADIFCRTERAQNRLPENMLQTTGYGLAVSLGGDGTVLFAARTAAPHNIPLMPVNMGTLGFIASVSREDMPDVFAEWSAGKSIESRRLMLEVRVERGGNIIFTESCLNDAVISADGIAKTIRLNASVLLGSETMEIASYRSDGLIIATPTGSTAYSASAGGPILDPEADGLILNPICPFTLLHRPLVLPAGNTINIAIPDGQRTAIILTIDGQVTSMLEPGDHVLIRKAAFQARLIATGRTTFYKALHTKLAWPTPGRLA